MAFRLSDSYYPGHFGFVTLLAEELPESRRERCPCAWRTCGHPFHPGATTHDSTFFLTQSHAYRVRDYGRQRHRRERILHRGLISPASILPAHYVPTEASAIFAMYAAARTIPLAVITLVAIFKRSAAGMLILGTLAGVIQVLDCMVGMVQHDPGKIFGPLVIAALQFYAVATLKRSASRRPRSASDFHTNPIEE
jgi:hypothetical protein